MVKKVFHVKTHDSIHHGGKQLKKASKKKVPTVNEITIIKNEIYASCEKKRKMLGWVKCPKFILDPLVDRIMTMMNATPNDHFVDAGCGIGNIIAHVATRYGCQCTGIEIAECNLNVALEAENKFSAYRQVNNIPEPDISYLKGDLRHHLPQLSPTIDILWCTNLLFPIQLNAFLLGQLYRLRTGSRIFIMSDLVPDRENVGVTKYFEKVKFQWGPGDVEWTNEPGDLFMYTRTDIPYVG